MDTGCTPPRSHQVEDWGGCFFKDEEYFACSTLTPMEIVNGLAERKTQIIPLELIAAAGLLITFGEKLRGSEVVFFIDNQSVCACLCKGASRSRDIQHLSTAWHILCQHLQCGIWIEWVPSEANPADILSRQHRSEEPVLDLFDPSSRHYLPMVLPGWANQSKYNTIQKVTAEM